MSLSALALLLGYLAVFGVAQEPRADEGPAARIFQILLAGQAPIIGFFAFTWFPKMPKQALQVLALQIVFALAPFILVFILES